MKSTSYLLSALSFCEKRSGNVYKLWWWWSKGFDGQPNPQCASGQQSRKAQFNQHLMW